MLEWIGDTCIETLGILCGSESPITIVFIFADESRNYAMICSTSGSIRTLRGASGVRFESSLPLFWCS